MFCNVSYLEPAITDFVCHLEATTRRYGATLVFIWTCVCDELTNINVKVSREL